MSGYVYLLRMGDTDYYKVGVSASDPKIRIASLQIGNPIELHLIAVSEQERPYQVEKDIHDALEEYQVRNEWFRSDREAIQRLFRDYTAMATIDTVLFDPIVVPDPEAPKPTDDRINRQERRAFMRQKLTEMAADGKGREYARQWAKENGLQFDNKTWTEIREGLGI